MISANSKIKRSLINLKWACLLLVVLFAGCTHFVRNIDSAKYKELNTENPERSILRNNEFIILIANSSDNFESLALEFLGTESRAWEIKSFNKINKITAGQEVVIPLTPLYPLGIYADGYQTIPILCYHRFGLSEAKMTVTPEAFSAQMAYLSKNGYTVISLQDLIPFLHGKRQLPPKSVILTFDDGYKSFYMFAFPIMQKYKFPGTVFVYTDFVGTPDGLNWADMEDMISSGLIDIQPHSLTHSNLGINKVNESQTDYEKRIATEVTIPKKRIQQKLKNSIYSFAYPYGDTNKNVIKKLKSQEYLIGLTVESGSNPAFASPFTLRRTMVFGDDNLKRFQSYLGSYEKIDLR